MLWSENFIFLLALTPCKAVQPLQGKEKFKKKFKNNQAYNQDICLEKTYI